MKPALVILAAGAGVRFGGPKQLAPVGPGGEALLEYSVFDGLRAGFGTVVLVIRAESEAAFRSRFDGGMARRVPLRYVHQTLDDLPDGFSRPAGRSRPWGTGHALLAAAAAIDGPFAALNADDLYGAGSFTRLAACLTRRDPGTVRAGAVVAFPVAATLSGSGPVSRALCRLDAAGRLAEIRELGRVWEESAGRILASAPSGAVTALPADAPVSMNLWGFGRWILPELALRFRAFLTRSAGVPEAEFLLPDAVNALLGERDVRIEVVRGTGPWCGLTYRDDERRAAALLARLVASGRYPARLWG